MNPDLQNNLHAVIQALLNDYGVYLLVLVALLLLKDWVSNVAASILFAWGRDFNEDEYVLINDRRGRIKKIGLRRTKFHMYDSASGLHTEWIVNNDRVKYLQIERFTEAPPWAENETPDTQEKRKAKS